MCTNNQLHRMLSCTFLAIFVHSATVSAQDSQPQFMPSFGMMPMPMPMAFGPPPAPYFVPVASPGTNFGDAYKQMFGHSLNDNTGSGGSTGRQVGHQGSNSNQHDAKPEPPTSNHDTSGEKSIGHNSHPYDQLNTNGGGYSSGHETPLQQMMRNNFNEIVNEVKEDDRRQESASQPVDWRRVRDGMNRAGQYYGMARTGLAVGRVLGRILWYSSLPAGPIQG